jgi:hypothetical protein
MSSKSADVFRFDVWSSCKLGTRTSVPETLFRSSSQILSGDASARFHHRGGSSFGAVVTVSGSEKDDERSSRRHDISLPIDVAVRAGNMWPTQSRRLLRKRLAVTQGASTDDVSVAISYVATAVAALAAPNELPKPHTANTRRRRPFPGTDFSEFARCGRPRWCA